MNDFVLSPPRDYVSELLALAPQFALSKEYIELDSDERGTAGLVYSAFGRFMERSLADEAIRGECVRAMEQCALQPDPNLHNLLIVEVFEGWHNPDGVTYLLPVSRALYDRWIGR